MGGSEAKEVHPCSSQEEVPRESQTLTTRHFTRVPVSASDVLWLIWKCRSYLPFSFLVMSSPSQGSIPGTTLRPSSPLWRMGCGFRRSVLMLERKSEGERRRKTDDKMYLLLIFNLL